VKGKLYMTNVLQDVNKKGRREGCEISKALLSPHSPSLIYMYSECGRGKCCVHSHSKFNASCRVSYKHNWANYLRPLIW
jgi:hypothetical protein